MEDGTVKDNQISASSNLYYSYDGPNNARLNSQLGAWWPMSATVAEWIRVNMDPPEIVSGITLQGYPSDGEWVSRYKVEYINGTSQQYIKDASNDDVVRREKRVYAYAYVYVVVRTNAMFSHHIFWYYKEKKKEEKRGENP